MRTLAKHAPGVGLNPLDDKGRIAKNSFDLFEQFPNCSPSEIPNHFYTFTFVRNPYTRVLSAYLDKALRGNLYDEKHRLRQSDSPIGFMDFLRELEESNLDKNAHWAPQHAILPAPIDRMDFVGRVESLDVDLPYVITKIFKCECQMQIRQHGSTNSNSRIEEFYGPQERRLVQKLYEKDFELLYPNEA